MGIVNPWIPMTNPLDLKHLGKLGEELGECAAAVNRCIIQGIDEHEPVTGKQNRSWLTEEIADVIASAGLVIIHFGLNEEAVIARSERKMIDLKIWHAMVAKQSLETAA